MVILRYRGTCLKAHTQHILDKKLDDGSHSVTIINWNDHVLTEAPKLIELIGKASLQGRYRVVEMPRQEMVGLYGLKDQLPPYCIAPHGHIILQITKEEEVK